MGVWLGLVLASAVLVALAEVAPSDRAQSLAGVSGVPAETAETAEPSKAELRAALKDKRRRLRRLRGEVDALTASLKADSAQGPSTQTEGSSTKRRPKGGRVWRRRVVGELKRLRKQLAKHKLLKAAGKGRRKAPGKGKGKRRRSKAQRKRRRLRSRRARKRSKKRAKLQSSLAQAEMRRQELAYKISSLKNSQDASRRGEAGAACAAQRDCRPGLCCHGQSGQAHGQSQRNPSVGPALDQPSPATVPSGRCLRHSLSQGALCSASCQCVPPLHCFLAREAGEARCEEPETHHALQGHYLDPQQLFPASPP